MNVLIFMLGLICGICVYGIIATLAYNYSSEAINKPIKNDSKTYGLYSLAQVLITRDTVIAVDFDGTLAITDYPQIVKGNNSLIKFIKNCKEKGAIIILWTCREGEALDMAVDWCYKQGLEFNYVNQNAPHRIVKFSDCRKLGADLYIDDKAINPLMINFEEVEIISESN